VSYLARDWQARVAQKASWLDEHRQYSLVRNVWISGNRVSDAYWGRGIAVVGGQDVTIDNNDISRIGMAAGVLVAREDGYHTHGVTNVLVQRNRIAEVQTLAPTYVPEGPNFAELLGKLANNGGRTNHGGIEIHNLSPSQEMQTAFQQSVLAVSNVVVSDNVVSRATRDGVRVGADSQWVGLVGVGLYRNQVESAGHMAYENRTLDGRAVPMHCDGNKKQGESTVPSGCQSGLSEPMVAGARLTCSAF
jgi:Right handed beta helix region